MNLDPRIDPILRTLRNGQDVGFELIVDEERERGYLEVILVGAGNPRPDVVLTQQFYKDVYLKQNWDEIRLASELCFVTNQLLACARQGDPRVNYRMVLE